MASLGVYWAHFLMGYNIDFLGAVGLILLVGVVVNNGIVLIDYVNRLRQEGHSRTDALLTATARRFRDAMVFSPRFLDRICAQLVALGVPEG
jgi:HAE1 family hydrophobic/amphiphilic exporter-1